MSLRNDNCKTRTIKFVKLFFFTNDLYANYVIFFRNFENQPGVQISGRRHLAHYNFLL